MPKPKEAIVPFLLKELLWTDDRMKQAYKKLSNRLQPPNHAAYRRPATLLHRKCPVDANNRRQYPFYRKHEYYRFPKSHQNKEATCNADTVPANYGSRWRTK